MVNANKLGFKISNAINEVLANGTRVCFADDRRNFNCGSNPGAARSTNPIAVLTNVCFWRKANISLGADIC